MNAAKMTVWIVGCLGPLMLAVMVVGCTGGDPEADLVAQPRSPVPDVPVPSDFELVEKMSRSRSRGSWRTVDYLYRGGGEKFAVKRFFERQMSINGWTLVDQRFVQGRATLNYVKSDEICCITIYSGSAGWNGTYIHVDVSPGGDTIPAGKSTKFQRKK